MPKPMYINPKIIKQYSEDKGSCYNTIKRVESKEVLFRIPLSETLYAQRDNSLGLFAFPLVLKLLQHKEWLSKYYSFDTYKSMSAMYVPIYKLEQICKKGELHFPTIVIQYFGILHILYCLVFVRDGEKTFDQDYFERFLHAFHIVDTRCALNQSTNDIHLVDNFDHLNHSSTPNATYTFDSKYLVVKALCPIKQYTEIEVTYGQTLSREKLFAHYFFIDESIPSKPIDTEDNFHVHSILEYIQPYNQMSIYDIYLNMLKTEETGSSKVIFYHLEMLCRNQ